MLTGMAASAEPRRCRVAARWLPALLASALGGVVLGGAYLLRRPLPRVRGEVRLDGLDQPVEILRDRWGVPHCYAATAQDLFFAQGYVHAQDRLWQMELVRRLASGTLAEVVGEAGLVTDRFFRHVGLRRAGAAEAERLDEETRRNLDAYAAGVNAFLAGHVRRLPIEFTLLRYAPDPWSPLDTLTWSQFISWALSANWETELLRGRLVEWLGPEAAAALEPAYPDGNPIVATPGCDHSGPDGFALDHFRDAQRFLRAAGAGPASNAWAVGGARSATGRPLLANDPHLQPQIPGFWHEIHLSGAGYDVAGVGVPGVPGVVIGHNQRIAWGITVSFADAQDLYVERPNPANPRQFEYQGRWEDAQVLREVIRVKGRAEPVVEEVLITRHGPILSPVLPGEQRPIALRSAPQEPGQPGAIFDLDRAGNWDEFRAALAKWSVGSLSFAYADVDGNVGYQLAGRVPIRASGCGLAPVPGWTGEHEWIGYVPADALPGVLNPPTHYVVTANNKVVADDYPYLISREWADGYRARRISDLLEARPKHDVGSFAEIQRDVYSLPAAEFRRILLQIAPADAIGRRALDVVRAWDCRIAADSAGAALYEVFRHYLLRNVFGGKLGDQVERYLGLGHETLIHTHLYHIRVTSHLLRLLRERPAGWFDATPGASGRSSTSAGLAASDEAGEGSRPVPSRWPRSWDEALEASFREAVLFLRASLGDDPTRWRWGDLHRLTFRHVLGVGPLRWVLNRGAYPMPGDSDTVCAANTDVAEPFLAQGFLVSYRQIIDLADFDRSVSVLPAGQSGHPGSPHYADQTALWRAGKYHPAPFSRRAVLAAAVDRLILRPAP